MYDDQWIKAQGLCTLKLYGVQDPQVLVNSPALIKGYSTIQEGFTMIFEQIEVKVFQFK